MKDQKKAEEIAAQRMQLLSPLLDKGLDPGQARQIKARICEESGISERTLRRYLSHYRKDALTASSPKAKEGEGRSHTREHSGTSHPAAPAGTSRSISQIIQIWSGRAW